MKKIFNSKLRPVFSYGCGARGFQNGNKLERIQSSFFKKLVGLSDKSNGLVLRDDLVLTRVRVTRLVSMVSYWEKLVYLQGDRLLKTARQKC